MATCSHYYICVLILVHVSTNVSVRVQRILYIQGVDTKGNGNVFSYYYPKKKNYICVLILVHVSAATDVSYIFRR